MEESLAAMLSTESSAGVAPEVNLRECVTCMPLPNVNRAVYREEITKVQNRVSFGCNKKTYVLQIFVLKKLTLDELYPDLINLQN